MKKLVYLFSLVCFLFSLSGCSGGGGTTISTAPTGVTATGGNAQVTLSWTASSGAASYNIYFGTATGVTTASTSKITGTTGTTYTQTGLTNGTTYYYIVTAVNSAGESPASTQASATPQPAVAIAPTGVTATAGNGQVALSWTASANATTYNIYYGTSSGVTTTNGTKISSITSTTYTQNGLTNGATYYYIVTAVNSAGESPASTQASATPQPVAAAAPTAVTATAGNAQVALSWTASTGAATYNIYYGTTTGVTATSGTKISGIAATTYTQTGLTNGTTYYYVVTAVNSGGESPISAQVSAKPLPPAPTAPTALTAQAGNTQISLSWTAGANASSYNVYYGTATGVTTATGTKVAVSSGTGTTISSLVNGTTYYFIVTSVNLAGESVATAQVSATPVNGITVNLVPGSTATGTLQASTNASITFNFPANAVTQNAVASISPVTQAGLAVPLARPKMANAHMVPLVTLADTFVAAFNLSLNPTSITAFGGAVTLTGSVGSSIPTNTTLNLAILKNGSWVDIATFIIGTSGSINQNIASVTLPGLLAPGSYLVYQPAAGTSTAVSNLGVALIADDGYGMSDGSGGLQVVHIYDTNGNVLATPTVTLLDYPSAYDLDGQALTPDGSQGIMVDGGNTVRFLSKTQTGTTVASTATVDISSYGGDGDSIGILPTGDEAVVSGDSMSVLLVVSGIVSGKPVAAATIPIPSNRDGVVVSNDGTVLLARGGTGLTVYAIKTITPVAGTIGGTVSHSYTQLADLAAAGSSYYSEDGRNGMAPSPIDSTRAVVTSYYNTSVSASTIALLTGLTTTPVVSQTMKLPTGLTAYSVSVTPDGKNAIVGTSSGMLLYTGVDTGTLTLVGTSSYAPKYTAGTASYTLGLVTTLGITLDGKYVVAGDSSNRALVVVPFTSAGFAAAPASAIGGLAIPYNDQLLIH